MKIFIDDQYKNDENNQYTMDEDGNINLFISIGDESEKGKPIDFNNNIESNEVIGEIENNFEEFNEKKGQEPFIVESDDNNGNTINTENPFEEEKFERNYRNIYAEIENNLQEKYSNNTKLNYVDEEEVKDNNYIEKNEINNREDFNLNNQLEYDLNNQLEYDFNNQINEEYNKKKDTREVEKRGVIEVYSKLGSKEGIELRGARINLYLLNGVSPKLYDSKFTDTIGKVTFNNLPNGCYRIIAIVDRRYFEKPIYYNWNEVTIDRNNKYSSIVVVNKIKAGYYKR